MPAMETAESILRVVEWWSWIGLIVAVPFLSFGVDRIDESARGTYLFRVLAVPGVVLLWPIVLFRWVQLERRGRSR
ncbi:MAG: hypothetical protein AAFW46_16545 [Pseudomonadota bacterium]